VAKKKTQAGETLRVYRKAKGFTLAYMGKQVGVTHQQYQRYENGETPPPFDRLEKMIQILEIPPNKLFKVGKINDYSEQFEKKIQKYAKLLKMIESDPRLLKMIKAFGRK
jgi:transcriptional regulator with XRE-family HTH domain